MAADLGAVFLEPATGCTGGGKRAFGLYVASAALQAADLAALRAHDTGTLSQATPAADMPHGNQTSEAVFQSKAIPVTAGWTA